VSRHELPSAQFDVVIGWDPPLESFFLIVKDPRRADDDQVVAWFGATPRAFYELGKLEPVMPGWIRRLVTPGLRRELYLDRDEGR
jgi:hypothetical protein